MRASSHVKPPRNTPATRVFRLPAPSPAGRLSASSSTVPEISPSELSKADTCAFALGIQMISTRFREKLRTRIGTIGKNLSRRDDFLTPETSRRITTYSALLRGSSEDLAAAGVNPCGHSQLLPSLSPR